MAQADAHRGSRREADGGGDPHGGPAVPAASPHLSRGQERGGKELFLIVVNFMQLSLYFKLFQWIIEVFYF